MTKNRDLYPDPYLTDEELLHRIRTVWPNDPKFKEGDKAILEVTVTEHNRRFDNETGQFEYWVETAQPCRGNWILEKYLARPTEKAYRDAIDNAIEVIGRAAQVVEGIRGATQHCDCPAFGMAEEWLHETHGGALPIKDLNETLDTN